MGSARYPLKRSAEAFLFRSKLLAEGNRVLKAFLFLLSSILDNIARIEFPADFPILGEFAILFLPILLIAFPVKIAASERGPRARVLDPNGTELEPVSEKT